MAVLVVYDEAAVSGEPTWTAAGAAGDEFLNDGRTRPFFRNRSAAPITVTATAKRRCSHGFLDSESVTVPANAVLAWRELAGERFNDPATNRVSLTYSTHVELDVAAVRANPI